MPRRNPELTSRIMSRIRSKNTKPERMLAKSMWRLGLRYRKHYKLTGHPDFAFIGPRVAVFCDGDFWHGRDLEKRIADGRFKSNKEYWINKISRNRERDLQVTVALEKQGWLVLRFWESEIIEDADACAQKVLGWIQHRKI